MKNAVRAGLAAIFVSGLVGCTPWNAGCIPYFTEATAVGIGYRVSEPDIRFDINLSRRLEAVAGRPRNDLFASFRPTDTNFMEYCLSELPLLHFRVGAMVDIGESQSGQRLEQTPKCFQDFEGAARAERSFVGGGIEVDSSYVRIEIFEATLVGRSPPTHDVRFEGEGEDGATWVFELQVISGVAGNSEFCD